MDEKRFEIEFNSTDAGREMKLTITHTSETFDFRFEGTDVSLINNGDNSWSSVKGQLEQEIVNEIGQEIEKHYQNDIIP
ncbi:hypothetical protein [Rubrolithibacter danxiaensis]|uniref:hypothetical protein n=1 Tax=Rubrolithibacter danxiaensis TaxID=3390805 RepID=UPI003BF83F6D